MIVDALTELRLPLADGTVQRYRLERSEPTSFAPAPAGAPRRFLSAAHVTANALADDDPWLDSTVDWDTTLAFREYLYGLGLGVAEAMDTAQRGAGLTWPKAKELIMRSAAHAKACGAQARLACGAGTDQLDPNKSWDLDSIASAYVEQAATVEEVGAQVILMASRALAASARSSEDYLDVYNRVLSQLSRPAIIHWLGEMFDPALAGYWGTVDHGAAMNVALDLIASNASRVDGVKISLLSAEREIQMRRRLPAGVRMYSGDDFNYPELIVGDDLGHSDALLGIFAAIAPAAAAALAALTDNDAAAFNRILAPTLPLSRTIFRAPTRFYKTGVVFMAYLNGHQDHFVMLGGQQSARSAVHLAEIFRLADKAGVLIDPERAVRRVRAVMETCGVS